MYEYFDWTLQYHKFPSGFCPRHRVSTFFAAENQNYKNLMSTDRKLSLILILKCLRTFCRLSMAFKNLCRIIHFFITFNFIVFSLLSKICQKFLHVSKQSEKSFHSWIKSFTNKKFLPITLLWMPPCQNEFNSTGLICCRFLEAKNSRRSTKSNFFWNFATFWQQTVNSKIYVVTSEKLEKIVILQTITEEKIKIVLFTYNIL